MENIKSDNIIIDENVLFFAFRYSLGRMSAAPSIVASNIKKNIDKISEYSLNTMIKEISECPKLGTQIDEDTWNHLKDEIKDELKLRLSIPPVYNIQKKS